MENFVVPACKNPNCGDDAPSMNMMTASLPPEFINDSLTPPQAVKGRFLSACSVDDLLASDEPLGATPIRPPRSNRISL
jgi:hypothetical protein